MAVTLTDTGSGSTRRGGYYDYYRDRRRSGADARPAEAAVDGVAAPPILTATPQSAAPEADPTRPTTRSRKQPRSALDAHTPMTTPLAEFRLDRSTAIATAGLTLAACLPGASRVRDGSLALRPVDAAHPRPSAGRAGRADHLAGDPRRRGSADATHHRGACREDGVHRSSGTSSPIDLYGSGDSQRYDVNGAADRQRLPPGRAPAEPDHPERRRHPVHRPVHRSALHSDGTDTTGGLPGLLVDRLLGALPVPPRRAHRLPRGRPAALRTPAVLPARPCCSGHPASARRR